MENDLIKPSRIEDIRSRYAVNKTADDYRAMPISEIAQMRLDIKRLLKAVDARPEGHVLDNGNPICGPCSECGESMSRKSNYCPNCGARMEGGEDDD